MTWCGHSMRQHGSIQVDAVRLQSRRRRDIQELTAAAAHVKHPSGRGQEPRVPGARVPDHFGTELAKRVPVGRHQRAARRRCAAKGVVMWISDNGNSRPRLDRTIPSRL